MMVRTVLALVATATPLAAQLPAGWTGRADRGEATGIKFAAMGPGFHVSPGSSGIVFRAADMAGEKFHTLATFTQTKPSAHPEGYGLFFGGTDLAGNQQYTYFLIRSDGKYLVKKRTGATTAPVMDWTENAAVLKADSAGKATNKLEIDAASGKVAFKVNGKTVHEMETPNRAGIIGLRLNHGLDLHVADFAVHPLK